MRSSSPRRCTTRGRSAQAYFQASILAERDGHWVLARTYAERAKVQYEELTDRANVGRLLNNLGGLEFLLGKPEQAIEHLKHSFAVALEIGREEDAATAVSSLAQVHLRTGDHLRAEEQALHALEIIGDRDDMIDEIGNARLVLGRALLEQDRLDEAETALRCGGRCLCPAVVGLASRCGVDRARRPGDETWRRTPCVGALPPRCRDAPGFPLLTGGGVLCGKQTRCGPCSSRPRPACAGRSVGRGRQVRSSERGYVGRPAVSTGRVVRPIRWGAGTTNDSTGGSRQAA